VLVTDNKKSTDNSHLNNIHAAVHENQEPIVVIGNGPVGIRFIQSLQKRDPDKHIIVYGKEPWEPYNRVKLSSVLSGETKFSEIKTSTFDTSKENIDCRYNCEVIKVDPVSKIIFDDRGGCQSYEKLVLATGSHAHIPNIKGIDQKGVYVFRDLTDTQHLLARQVRARNVVVIGGGLLGLEAAKAMQRNNTEVTIIEHTPRLMNSQLDETASEVLREYIMSQGIKVRLGDSVKEIIKDKHGISSIRLSSCVTIDCDTIIVSTGIKSNIELARQANLSVGRGIRVDDSMRTSAKDVYAIGECCEHRDKVYGLVAPGYEQAEVAAHSILNGSSKYKGSITATNLKVIDNPVFSMGEILNEGYQSSYIEYKFRDYNSGVYRKIIVKNKRIVGAIAVGEWHERGRVQTLIDKRKMIMPWQLVRFKKYGKLIKDQEESSVNKWPGNTIICNCTGKTRAQLSKAISTGCTSLDSLAKETGASLVCGSCKPHLVNLIGSNEKLAPVKMARTISVISIMSLILIAGLLSIGGFYYNQSASDALQYDILWRSSLVKQISGFGILTLSIASVSISLRKRLKKINYGHFDIWRGLHIIVSIAAIAALIAHTGFRAGNNLNLYLMTTFIVMLVFGMLSAMVIGNLHRLDQVTVTGIRKKMLWGHILLFWPIPALLTFHIIKSYYF